MVEHVWRLIRSGQARFRAETYGLYFPALPGSRPAWKVSPITLVMLARTLPRYARWHRRMEILAMRGGHDWWAMEWPGIDLEGKLARSRDAGCDSAAIPSADAQDGR
jgi:hypothetical protein